MSPPIPKSIALVDYQHMLTVNVKATANDAGPNYAGQRTLDQLAAVRSSCEHVIICMDSPPYWRRNVYPPYKASRAEREPEYAPILRWTNERVMKDGFNVAAAPTEEADDVIATLARIYSEDYGCTDVRIIGADKDALQCVSDSVRLFVPKERGEFDIRGPEWLLKTYGVTPEQFPLLLAIMGDTSDNIPGIKGLGKGHGAKLIGLYKTIEGMANGLTASANDAQLNGKELSAVWKNYAAGMSALPMWVKLTTLNTNVTLDKQPLKYLEKLPMQKLVDDTGYDMVEQTGVEIEELDLIDPDWDAVEAKADAEMRAEMAKALPVEPAPKYLEPQNSNKVVDRPIGKDPKAEYHLRKAAEERSKTARSVSSVSAHSPTAAPQQAHVPATPIQTLNLDRHGQERPKAPDAPNAASNGHQAAAPAGSPQAGASQVVPPTMGPPKAESEGTLARVPPPNWALAAQPQSPSQIMWIATQMVNSRAHAAYGRPEAIFNAISLGRELGLGYATSLDAFHLYNNKPLLKAVTYKALAEQHPDCDWIVITDADDTQATIKTKHRKIGEMSYTYTAERARKAGYFTGGNKDNWNNKTQEMLEARATTKAIRRWYAGVIVGRRSLEEEQDDD